MLQISRILYNYTFLAFSQVAMVAIGIFTTAMLARFLGPHEYGRYNLFIFFVQVLSIFASTWIINPAAAKFANQEFLTSKNIKKTFSSEVLIILFNIIFVGLVLFFLRSRVHNFLGGYGNTRVLLAFSYLIIFALYNLCYGSLQGAMDFKSYGIMPLMRAVIFMLFLSALMAGSFNFDFIVVSKSGKLILIDVKGKQFPYVSKLGKNYWENWVGLDDVKFLEMWAKIFNTIGIIVFPYLIRYKDDKKLFKDISEFRGNSYGIVAIEVNEYHKNSKPRSKHGEGTFNAISISREKMPKLVKPISFYLGGLQKSKIYSKVVPKVM